MDFSTVEIETERLFLLPISPLYREQIFREFTSEITTYMLPCPAETIADTDAFISGALDGLVSGKNLQLVILLKGTEAFLGCCGIHKIESQQPELGIWTKKSSHGHRYGREAVGGLISWACENLSFDYLKYPVDRRNLPSRRIPESFGGCVINEYQETGMGGNDLDIVEYRIDRGE